MAEHLLGKQRVTRIDPVVPDGMFELDRLDPALIRGLTEGVGRRSSAQIVPCLRHPNTLGSVNNFAVALRRSGKFRARRGPRCRDRHARGGTASHGVRLGWHVTRPGRYRQPHEPLPVAGVRRTGVRIPPRTQFRRIKPYL